MFTFEEILQETKETMNQTLYRFRNLKTEKEDLKQELILKLWELYEKGKFDDIETIEHLRAFTYNCYLHELQTILVREHKQGLYITESIFKDEFNLIDSYDYSSNEVNLFYDEFLEKKREYFKKYQKEHRKQINQKQREWYQKNREKRIAQNKKCYYIKRYGIDAWNQKLLEEERERERIKNENLYGESAIIKSQIKKAQEMNQIELLENFLFGTCFISNYSRKRKYNRDIIQLELKEYYSQKPFIRDILLDYIRKNGFEFKMNENVIELIQL